MLSFLFLYSRRVWTIVLLEDCWSTGFTHTTTGHICKVKKPWLYQDYPGLEAIQNCPGSDFENQSYLGVGRPGLTKWKLLSACVEAASGVMR